MSRHRAATVAASPVSAAGTAVSTTSLKTSALAAATIVATATAEAPAPTAFAPSLARRFAAGRMKALRRNMRSSLVDGGMFSIMVGCGETYFPAFALALGLSQVASGLVATLPLLVGSMLQLAAPYGLKRLGSYRRWIVFCVLCQAAVFVPLIGLALDRSIPAWLVFVFTSVYWGTGLATGPAWNTWIGTLVPVSIRARFFAWRTRIVQAGTLLGFVIGGLVLQFGAGQGATLAAFAALFVTAGLCRFISGLSLARQGEPVVPGDGDRHVSLREFVSRIGKRADGKFLLYLMAIQAAVQLSGPYFTPYMLKQLQLSYVDYMVLVATAFTGKMVSLPWLGQLAHRYGPRKLLVWGSVGILPLSAMWLVSEHFAWMLFLQFAGGVAWAAYELAWFLLFFEMLPKHERTSVLTTFNFGHSLASVMGSLIGGAILMTLGEHREVYLGIFVASGVLRLLTFVFLRPRFTSSPRDGYHRPARSTHSIDIAAAVPHGAPPSAGGAAAPAGGLTVPVVVDDRK
jgi:MFS family permease